jgi:hypothetical protein
MAHGKLGRIPRDTTRWAPTLETYLRTHPVSGTAGLEPVGPGEEVDRASKVTDWPMYCNGPDPANPPSSPDGIGDCTVAEAAHAFTALGVYAGKEQVLFPDSEIIAAYAAISGYDPVTGSNDNGCQMQDVLRYLRDTGLADANGQVHKVTAYAALADPTDIQMLSQVLKTFGYVYLGIDLPQSAEDEFGTEPWTYVPWSQPLGGHCIGLHRRDPYGTKVGVFTMATWGALQPATIGFIRHWVREAWAVITPDWIEANGASCDGISLAQLEADMPLVGSA